jgi:hypothetical protein
MAFRIPLVGLFDGYNIGNQDLITVIVPCPDITDCSENWFRAFLLHLFPRVILESFDIETA